MRYVLSRVWSVASDEFGLKIGFIGLFDIPRDYILILLLHTHQCSQSRHHNNFLVDNSTDYANNPFGIYDTDRYGRDK